MASSLTLGVFLLSALATVHCGTVKVWGLRGSGLSGDATSAPDAYVKVWCGAVSGGQTHIIDNNHNPSWSNEFTFTNVKAGSTLKLEVWDKDIQNNDHLGTCSGTISTGSYTAWCSFKKGRLDYSYSFV